MIECNQFSRENWRNFLIHIFIGFFAGWLSSDGQPVFFSIIGFLLFGFFTNKTLDNNWDIKKIFFFWCFYFLGQNFWLNFLVPINSFSFPFVGLFFALLLSVFWGIQYVSLRFIFGGVEGRSSLLSATFFITLLEFSRNYFLCGIPFYPASYFFTRIVPLIGIYSFIGVTLTSFLVYYTIIFFPRFYRRKIGYCGMFVVAFFTLFNQELYEDRPVRFAVFPTTSDPYDDTTRLSPISFIQALKELEDVDCVVLPEGFWSLKYFQNYPSNLSSNEQWVLRSIEKQILEISKEKNLDILLPFTHVEKDNTLRHSVGLIHQGELKDRYDKIHLMSIMESRWSFLGSSINESIGSIDYVGGIAKKVLKGNHRYGVFICFDDYFGNDKGKFDAKNIDFLISIHNDIWVDHSAFKENHLYQAVIRCVESGVSGIRVANGGISAKIYPDGSYYEIKELDKFSYVDIKKTHKSCLYPDIDETWCLIAFGLFCLLERFRSRIISR